MHRARPRTCGRVNFELAASGRAVWIENHNAGNIARVPRSTVRLGLRARENRLWSVRHSEKRRVSNVYCGRCRGNGPGWNGRMAATAGRISPPTTSRCNTAGANDVRNGVGRRLPDSAQTRFRRRLNAFSALRPPFFGREFTFDSTRPPFHPTDSGQLSHRSVLYTKKKNTLLDARLSRQTETALRVLHSVRFGPVTHTHSPHAVKNSNVSLEFSARSLQTPIRSVRYLSKVK